MGNWASGLALRALVALVCIVAVVWVALWYFIPAPPSSITIAAGIKGGAFEHIANRYKARLARHHVTLKFHFASAGGSAKLDSGSEIGRRGERSCSPASSTATTRPTSCRSAALEPRRSGFSTAGRKRSTASRSSRASAPTSPLPPAISSTASSPPTASSRAIRRSRRNAAPRRLRSCCRDGEVDVAILPPIDLDAPSIQAMLRDPNIQLMNVTQAEAITRLFPVAQSAWCCRRA